MARKRKPIAIGKRIPAEFRICSSGQSGTGLRASEKDADGRIKSFSMLAYTGGRLLLAEFDYPVIVDLKGLSVPRPVLPILRQHDQDRPVGHTTRVAISAQQIELEGLISAANVHAEEVAESGGNGFPWESSIGARATRMVFVDKGDTVQVNGQEFTGPVFVATKSVLKEVSFVVIGADEDGATATVAATAAKEGMVMTNQFKAWLKAQGFAKPETLSSVARKNLLTRFREVQAADDDSDEEVKQKKDVDAEGEDDDDVEAESDDDDVEAEDDEEGDTPEKTVKAADRHRKIKATGKTGIRQGVTELRASQAQERRRIAKIDLICAKYPTAKYKGASLSAHAIEAGWSPDKTELFAMRNDRPKAPAGHVAPGRDELNGQAVEAALLMSTSHSEEFVGKQYNQKVMNAAMSKAYRGFTLHALMAHVIRAAGLHYSGSHKSNDFIRTMKQADRELAAAGFSTLRVSNVLENVANKSLIASYQAQEVVWPEFTARKSYSDFKVQSRYRLDAQGSFRKVGPDGELKHIGLTDAKFSNQLDTFGAIITLNRQMMYNDDLDAFLEIPKHLGQMGATRVEEAFFILLLSNLGNFYHNNNRNLITGGTSAFGITALSAAEAKFRNQVTPNGKPLLTSPKKLLVPTTLAVDAENLFAEKLLIAGTATNAQPARNPHAGKYSPFVSPYLNNTAITDQDGNAISGQSDTAWFLFSDPNVLAAIVIGFLNGQSTPTIESDDTPFETLGMQWRGYLDFGLGFEDPVGSLKSAGA